MTLRWLGWGTLACAIMFGLGWFVGGSGRSGVELDRRSADERADFAEVRASVLDGRVSLYQSNFGDANRRFEGARVVVERLQSRLRQAGQAGRAGELEVAVSELREAQRLSLALDGAAQSAAARAQNVIDTVASAAASR